MGRCAWGQGSRRCHGVIRSGLCAGSPLVRHLLGAEIGIVEGRERLREFVRIVFERQPAARQRYRKGFFTDGHKLMWEYPRSRPGGEQMDFVEVMEIEDGLIRRIVFIGAGMV
jgi:hypothetical protein